MEEKKKTIDNMTPHISKNKKIDRIVTEKLKNDFESGEKSNAEILNRYFNQGFFKGEKSIIDSLIKNEPDSKFDDIKNEGINLAILQNNNLIRNFKNCLDKTSDEVKKAINEEIFNRVNSELGNNKLYEKFNEECNPSNNTNVLGYFQNVVGYLGSKEKEGKEEGKIFKKTSDILKNITITNENINGRLGSGNEIPTNLNLSDPSIPEATKKSFDALLSFEIGKEADRLRNAVSSVYKKIGGLFTNSLPAINTIIGENDELKFNRDNEEILGQDFQSRAKEIINDENLSQRTKDKKINELQREFYLKYVNSKNKKIGDALQKLYENNFDYSKLDAATLEGYLNEVTETRLKMLFEYGVNKAFNIDFWNLDQFKSFYKDLANPNIKTVQLSNVIIPGTDPEETGSISIPIKKTLIEGKNPWLKDINQFGAEGKAFDALPIRFEIDRNAITNNDNISNEDKIKLSSFLSRFHTEKNKYIIEGNDVGMLIYLFFVINNKTPITNFDGEEQKKIENLFGKTENRDKNGLGENNDENGQDENGDKEIKDKEGNEEGKLKDGQDKNGDKETKDKEGDKEYTPEQFKTDVETKRHGKFENGSEIWLPIGNSKLPGGGYQRMKIKVNKINMDKGTFTGTVFGGELKLKEGLEGASREIKMNKKELEDIENLAIHSDKICLLPNPSKSDFNSFKNDKNKLNNKLGNNELIFPCTGVNWDGNKFKKKIIDDNGKEKKIDIEYFGDSSDNTSTYKIKYNPLKHSFNVSSTYIGDGQDKDGKNVKKRFSYNRDMDRNNFLIFFTQKNLTPQTKEESNETIIRQERYGKDKDDAKIVNKPVRRLEWFSINNVKNGLKNVVENVNSKLKKYSEKRTKDFQHIVEPKILNAIASVPLPPSRTYAIGQRQQDLYNEQFNLAREKIEEYYKAIQSDGEFGDTFTTVPPHLRTLFGTSYRQFLINMHKKAKRKGLSNDERYKCAALLLGNIESGSSPYRSLTEYINTGFYVNLLLGNDHYNLYMRDREKCIADIKKAGKDKDQLQEALARSEMNYIINNIKGSNGDLPYFGSHEQRDGWKANPSKYKLSPQFADKLDESYGKRFNQTSVEESFNKISTNSFDLANADFRRFIRSGRYPKAIGNLKKMFKLAREDKQKSEAQKCFLIYLLSGVLDIYGDKELRKQSYKRGKTLPFLPGMLSKNTGHSQQIVDLLNDYSKGEFSKHVTSYFREGNMQKGNINVKELTKQVDDRRSEDTMEKFEKYSKTEFLTKDFPKNSILHNLQKIALDSGRENMDLSLLDNPKIVKSGGLLSNVNIVQDRMQNNGTTFAGNEDDERSDRAEFWNQITQEIRDTDVTNPKSVNLVLNQYLSWFGMNSESDRQKAYKRIHTAYYRKDRISKNPRTYNYQNSGKYIEMGSISESDIKDIVRYTFQGTVRKDQFSGHRIPPELELTLKEFQNFFWKAFNNNMLKDPIVVSDAFRTSNISSVKHMNLGSGELYKEVMSGGDNSMAPSPEEDFNNPEIRKRAQRASFKTGNFINDEMAQIERALKVHLFTGYRPITKDSESAPDSMKPASQVQSVESLKSQLKSNNPQQKNVVPLNTTNNEEDQMQQAA